MEITNRLFAKIQLFLGVAKIQRLVSSQGRREMGLVKYGIPAIQGKWMSTFSFDVWFQNDGKVVWWWRSFDRVVGAQTGKWGVLVNNELEPVTDAKSGLQVVLVLLEDDQVKTFTWDPGMQVFGEEWGLEKVS